MIIFENDQRDLILDSERNMKMSAFTHFPSTVWSGHTGGGAISRLSCRKSTIFIFTFLVKLGMKNMQNFIPIPNLKKKRFQFALSRSVL